MSRDADTPLPLTTVAASLLSVWRRIAGSPPPATAGDDPWADAFTAAAKAAYVALGAADERSDLEVSARNLATIMARAFCRELDRVCRPLDQMPARASVAWQAAARHASNLLLLDSSDRNLIAEYEGGIEKWAAKQLAQMMSPTP